MIKIHADSNGMMVTVNDTNSIKLKHCAPDKFTQKEAKLSCQWVANNDHIQKIDVTVNVFFKTAEKFEIFVNLFDELSCSKLTCDKPLSFMCMLE